ncbi:uncharacterized protein LOC123254086 isoform X2 [Gracilinanus agilis]|uniref:uncharacterized protein LOC123254086 isoform X2 n=1 Tax=Gracilinanus agilis TaxID=191870 RepID=UPI001CFF2A93|nr:uncharacterized protein LOC123254086 isoform X2 [Gracilinanus agilis]
MAAMYASVQKRGHPPGPSGAACDPAEAELEGVVYSTVKPRALRGGTGTPTEYTSVALPSSAALESPECSSPGSGRPLLSPVFAPGTARKGTALGLGPMRMWQTLQFQDWVPVASSPAAALASTFELENQKVPGILQLSGPECRKPVNTFLPIFLPGARAQGTFGCGSLAWQIPSSLS